MNHTQENGYVLFDNLIAQLTADGHDHTARRIQVLLRETAWTTGSELIGELGLEIIAFQRVTPSVTRELQKLLKRCMQEVRRVWPNIK